MIRSAGAAAVDSNHRPRAAALMAPPPQRAGRGFEWTIEPSGSGGDGEQPFVVFREASSSSAAAVGGGGRRGLLYASESKHGDGSLFLLCKVWFGAEPAPGSELLKKAQWEVQRVPGPGGTSYLRLASAFFDSQASPVPALLVATRGERPLFTWSTASGIPPETPTSPTARSRRRKFDQFANCGPSFHARGRLGSRRAPRRVAIFATMTHKKVVARAKSLGIADTFRLVLGVKPRTFTVKRGVSCNRPEQRAGFPPTPVAWVR